MDKPTKEERKQKVLIEARALIIEEGYAAFSMRLISRRTGMHLKTLQHYFPTKAQLLAALMDYVLEHFYESQYERLEKVENVKGPEDKLLLIIRYTLEDAKSEETVKFFTELWALAQREDAARDAMDRIYKRHCEIFESLIGEINPGLSEEKAAQRATIIAATLEGLGALFLGHGRSTYPHYKGIEDEVCESLMVMLKAR